VTPLEAITTSACFYDPDYPSTEQQDAIQRALVAEFNRKLESGELGTEEVPCLCGGEEFSLFATYDRYRVRQRSVLCKRCGLLQSRPRLSHEAFRWFYESDFYRRLYNPDQMTPTIEKFRSVAADRLYRFEFICNSVDLENIESVLEIGCGAGWNLEPYRAAGKKVVGYDQGPTLVNFGRSLGLELHHGSVEDVDGNGFDLIILSHIVEHFSDPVATVRKIADRLRPNGHIYIEVPDADHFALGGLQAAHTYWFSRRTLIHYMAHAGLSVGPLQNFGPHVGGLFHKAPNPARPNLEREYARMKALIRRYGWRQDIKGFLNRIGLLEFARQLRR